MNNSHYNSSDFKSIMPQNIAVEFPGKVTITGRVRCRFELFVRFYLPLERFGNHETHTFRGDKFTNEPKQMLVNLLRLFNQDKLFYKLAIIYDTTKPLKSPEREVLKYKNGKIVKDLVEDYKVMLK